MSLALTEDQRHIVRAVLAIHLPAGANVRVFGSRAKNASRPFSDLDLAVTSPERLTLAQMANLSEAFSECDLPFKVDVVDWQTANPVLQAAIDRDGVAI